MSGLLRDGVWVRESDWETDESGKFQRQQSVFRGRVSPRDVAPGRYRLYVSYACPWAHRTLIGRSLKGLGEVIPVTAVHPLMLDEGWELRNDDGEPEPEPELGATTLREIYVAADPRFNGRVTVPVLWDREARTIVNNESREILEMLDGPFAALATREHDLYPEGLRDRIDEIIDAIYEPINNGVYRCGFAGNQRAYEEAFAELFAALDRWDQALSSQPYLCGEQATAADICLFTTLFRFDPVYYVHFKCNQRRIVDYRHLRGFVRRFYQLPGVAATCRLDHIKRHYYGSHRQLNPKQIVPLGPALDWLEGAAAGGAEVDPVKGVASRLDS